MEILFLGRFSFLSFFHFRVLISHQCYFRKDFIPLCGHRQLFCATIWFRSFWQQRRGKIKTFMWAMLPLVFKLAMENKTWYFVTKIVLTYCVKKLFYWLGKICQKSRLKAENLQKFFDHLNNLFKQRKFRTNYG